MFRISLLVLLFLGLASSRGEEASSYDEAIKLSKQENKKIFLYFGASWCMPCQSMKKLFKEKEIKDKLVKFVVLVVDIEESPLLAKKYMIRSIPDYRILNSDLEEEKKLVGSLNRYMFSRSLSQGSSRLQPGEELAHDKNK